MTLALGGKSRRRISLLGLIAMVALLGAVLFAISAGGGASAQAPGDNITICHRTNSDANPYVVNSPNAAGVFNGHLGHEGPVWNPTLKDQGIMWGDIIPPFEFQGQTYSLNWDAEGMAIWQNGCQPVMATATPTTTATEAAETPTATPTGTAETPTATATSTEAAETPTATATATETGTPGTPTATATATETGTPETPTATATATETGTPGTPTATSTATSTATEGAATPTATATGTTALEPETQIPSAAGTQATEEAVAGVRAEGTPGAPETGTGTAGQNDAAKFGALIAGILAMTAGAAMLAIRKSR